MEKIAPDKPNAQRKPEVGRLQKIFYGLFLLTAAIAVFVFLVIAAVIIWQGVYIRTCEMLGNMMAWLQGPIGKSLIILSVTCLAFGILAKKISWEKNIPIFLILLVLGIAAVGVNPLKSVIVIILWTLWVLLEAAKWESYWSRPVCILLGYVLVAMVVTALVPLPLIANITNWYAGTLGIGLLTLWTVFKLRREISSKESSPAVIMIAGFLLLSVFIYVADIFTASIGISCSEMRAGYLS